MQEHFWKRPMAALLFPRLHSSLLAQSARLTLGCVSRRVIRFLTDGVVSRNNIGCAPFIELGNLAMVSPLSGIVAEKGIIRRVTPI
jgi:hypothetical protein